MRLTPARIARVMVLAVVTAAFAIAPGAARTADELRAENSTNQWLVELSGSADSFRSAAKKAGINYSERYAFSELWNGVSIVADPSKVASIRSLPGVVGVFPNQTFSLPPFQPDMNFAKALTGADIVQNNLGFTGAGIKVAVMDTGVDYDHPDLGGCFGPGCRVATGFDFVGDAYNDSDPTAPISPIPNPDPFPDDCNGHGTHVAGIIGANGRIKGVAPGVTFGAYRVFGCNGDTSSDVMIAAMERILRDKMDVLNMSIGSANVNWPRLAHREGRLTPRRARRQSRRFYRQQRPVGPLLRWCSRRRHARDRRCGVRQHEGGDVRALRERRPPSVGACLRHVRRPAPLGHR